MFEFLNKMNNAAMILQQCIACMAFHYIKETELAAMEAALCFGLDNKY